MLRGRTGAPAAVALLACSVVLGLIVAARTQRRAVLYTAAHAEVAPFQRIWNPDTNSDYTPRAFEGGDRDEGGVGLHDTLCGQSLEQDDCPEVPAFSGEDYFDEKQIGCCYSKEQQAVWDKWNALKHRVAKLEGQVQYLRNVKRNVQINQAEKAPLTTLTGGHTNSNTQRHALAHPQAVHRTRAGRRGGSRAARAFGTVGGKPYFHGIRLLERRRAAQREAKGGAAQLAAQPMHLQQLKAKKKAAPTSYFKAGPDQAARDAFLARKYQGFLAQHHPMQGGKVVDGKALEKYAKYVTTSSSIPEEDVPSSLGFKF
eukprot:Tamp_23582.p1 GENE.Tamp_23582~~Tamp_23582.p1  ORF type:complete len:314 (+),score=79.69 Tamp_23582:3-944(+)